MVLTNIFTSYDKTFDIAFNINQLSNFWSLCWYPNSYKHGMSEKLFWGIFKNILNVFKKLKINKKSKFFCCCCSLSEIKNGCQIKFSVQKYNQMVLFIVPFRFLKTHLQFWNSSLIFFVTSIHLQLITIKYIK